MRTINRNTLKADYSQKEYHRLQYNYHCNPKSNGLGLYIFNKPSGILDSNDTMIYEDDIVEVEYHKHITIKLIQRVVFLGGSFRLTPLISDPHYIHFVLDSTYANCDLYVADKMKVVDNIHENKNNFEIIL